MADGDCSVTLEAPSGLVEVMASCEGRKVQTVSYQAQTRSFVSAQDLQVEVLGWGAMRYELPPENWKVTEATI